MLHPALLPDLIALSAQKCPQAVALTDGKSHLTYDALNGATTDLPGFFLKHNLND